MRAEKSSGGDPSVMISAVPEALRNELTKIRVDHLYTVQREADKGVIEFSSIGLRGLLLVNGGGIIALLTFLGQQKAASAGGGFLWGAFILLGLGLFTGLLSIVLSYMSQTQVSSQVYDSAEKIYFHQIGDTVRYEEYKASEEKARKASNVWNVSAIAGAVLSALLFLAGSFSALNALILVTAVK